jgi:outer membrane autotransporter protein
VDRTGILAFALNYAGQSWNDTRTELGARADYRVMMDAGARLTLRGRAAWAHDFDTGRAIAAGFQALPGFGFTVIGASPAPDSALVSAGAELKFRNGVALRAKFDGEFAGRSNVYGGSGGVYVSW